MNSVTRCKPLLGTYIEVTVLADCQDRDLLQLTSAAFNEIERIQRIMSFHDSDSELSLINRTAQHQLVAVSEDLRVVLGKALELSRLTQGAFDITTGRALVSLGLLPDFKTAVDDNASWQDIFITEEGVGFRCPMQLDLGGIAKGYAVDCALEKVLALRPDADVVVNAGGDLRMSHWQSKQVALRSPSDVAQVVNVSMQAPAVATSGCYFLDGKAAIIDPGNGEPHHFQNSFSVFAPSCMLADALTKVAVLSRNCNELLDSLGAKLFMIDAVEEQV